LDVLKKPSALALSKALSFAAGHDERVFVLQFYRLSEGRPPLV